jgi:quercetin dioxygenase-like cupin family protein
VLIRTAIAAGPAVPEPYALTRLVDEGDADGRGTITIETLAAGATSPPGRTTAETITFVLSGSLTCNGSGRPLSAGDTMFHPPGCVRSFRNIGSEPALLFGAHSTASAERAGADGREAPQRVSLDIVDDPSLDRERGFISMGVRWLATGETVGSRTVTLGTSTFEPGGQHDLHRHPHAAEFLLIVSGRGRHLTEDGAAAMTDGQIVMIATGEWHGFCTDPGVTTRTVFGYLGAASLSDAGYELKPGGSDD